MKAVFLDAASLDAGDLDMTGLGAEFSDLTCWPVTAPDQVVERIRGMDVVISNKVVLNGENLRGSTVRLICVAATGTNNIDLKAARALDIAVCNVTHYAAASVSQHVFSLILRLLNASDAYQQSVADGNWTQSPFFCLLDFPIREISGLTIGIIGYGDLGQAVAQRARCLGMDVLVAESLRESSSKSATSVNRVPLSDLLARADVVSLHCPLTEATRNLIGAAELAQMKPDALLINTARGGIVDETALLDALQQGHIGGAGFDVLSEEPPPADHPMLCYRQSNLVITPHIAWASREARQRLTNIMVRNIQAYKQGERINRLD